MRNIAVRRAVLGACACGIAEVALAAGPKARADIDVKDPHVVNILASLPDGQPVYHCQYTWTISFKSGAEASDACMADVAPGSKDVSACTIKYDARVSQVFLVDQRCKPAS